MPRNWRLPANRHQGVWRPGSVLRVPCRGLAVAAPLHLPGTGCGWL